MSIYPSFYKKNDENGVGSKDHTSFGSWFQYHFSAKKNVIRLTTETLVLLSKLNLYSHRHKLIPVCNDCYCAEKTDVSRQRSTSIQHERSLISTVDFSI